MTNVSRVTRRVRWVAVAVIAGAVLCVLGVLILRNERPPLRVRRSGDIFIVDVQTLGEYETSVARVRLRRGQEVVWEVVAPGRAPQLHTFALRIGANPGVLHGCGGGPSSGCDRPEQYEEFFVVTPAREGSFRIEAGSDYGLEVWGSASDWSRSTATLSP